MQQCNMSILLKWVKSADSLVNTHMELLCYNSNKSNINFNIFLSILLCNVESK